MSETTIFGPPGTGKTTKLIEIVKDRISSGVDPKRIGFFSFSKKAATEARDRASVELGLDTKDMVYFRTLHSLAFQWLGLNSQNVFKGSDYNELGRLVGLDFRTSHTLNIEEGPLFNIGAGGDKYMAVIQMARVKQIEVQMQYVSGWDYDINWQQLNVLDKAYKDYKRVKGKYDFVDMIEKFIVEGTSPEFDLLIIDEAQDLAPLQWSMVKKVLVPNSKRVYYAGDDDQAIYTWMGVKVSDFLNSCDDKLFLTKSFRVPSAVHDFSQNLIKKVSTRQTKNWQPTKTDGTITWHRDILDVDLTSGEWLVLARTNYITNKVCNRLKEDGYLYWREGTGWSISPNVINGIEVWLKLCKNQSLSTVELKNFSKILSPNVISRSGRKLMSSLDAEQTYTLNDIIEKCSLNASHETPWQKVLKVSDQETAYIMSVRRRGERILTGTPRIRISTIHKAKGGEADNVALLLDSTKACVESLDQDSEIRTFYVGATRAKKTLHLIESNALHRFNI